MADFTVEHCQQTRRRRQALVANQVVCVEFCFLFIHPEMIRFWGWGCVTSVIYDGNPETSAIINDRLKRLLPPRQPLGWEVGGGISAAKSRQVRCHRHPCQLVTGWCGHRNPLWRRGRAAKQVMGHWSIL